MVVTRHWRRHGLQWALEVLRLDAIRQRGIIRVYGQEAASLGRREEGEFVAEARSRVRIIHGVVRSVDGSDWREMCASAIRMTADGVLDE